MNKFLSRNVSEISDFRNIYIYVIIGIVIEFCFSLKIEFIIKKILKLKGGDKMKKKNIGILIALMLIGAVLAVSAAFSEGGALPGLPELVEAVTQTGDICAITNQKIDATCAGAGGTDALEAYKEIDGALDKLALTLSTRSGQAFEQARIGVKEAHLNCLLLNEVGDLEFGSDNQEIPNNNAVLTLTICKAETVELGPIIAEDGSRYVPNPNGGELTPICNADDCWLESTTAGGWRFCCTWADGSGTTCTKQLSHEVEDMMFDSGMYDTRDKWTFY